MPGQHITDEQRRKFMKLITEEKLSVETAAAKSGFGRTSGFQIKKELKGESPEEKKPRGRRRQDPLECLLRFIRTPFSIELGHPLRTNSDSRTSFFFSLKTDFNTSGISLSNSE